MQEQKFNENEGLTIDLGRVVQALLKWAWVIVAAAIVFGLVAWIFSATMITPTYRSGFTAYVNNKQTTTTGSTTSSDLSASIALAYVYGEIIQSRTVLTEAASKCGLDYGYSALAGKVTISVAETTAIINVYVEDTSPETAMALAAAIADVAPAHVARVVDNSSMRIVDEPILPTSQHAPNNGTNAVIGALLGIVAAVAMVIVLEVLNDYVQSGEELEKRYDVIAIGVIPDMDQAEKVHSNYSYARAGGRK